jgi:hypothetical protein
MGQWHTKLCLQRLKGRLGRYRRRFVNNIQIYIACRCGIGSSDSEQGKVAWACEQDSEIFGLMEAGRSSRRTLRMKLWRKLIVPIGRRDVGRPKRRWDDDF